MIKTTNTLAKEALEIEANSIMELISRIDENFTTACDLLLNCSGRIIVTGMGKSGHIAGKIAATLASTGSPSFFIHPAEACHGDLGMITAKDIVIALSNSGESDEISTILPLIKRIGIPLISLTGNKQSTLARTATINIDVSVKQEACPLNLAPTSSTTAALAMGDAIAVCLLHAKGFSEKDFALSHPGGKLGRQLLLEISDIMHTGKNIPKVLASASLSETLLVMTEKSLGITAIVDNKDIVIGIFTDGDLRRLFEQGVDIRNVLIGDVMTTNCITIKQNILAAEALEIMESKKINALLVSGENGELVGALNMHDLLKAKVV